MLLPMVEDRVVKISKSGTRLAILLPPEHIEALKWKKGMRVQVHVDGDRLIAQKLRPLKSDG